MRVVVLGAAGGVGGHAVRLAVGRGHEVAAVARRPGAPADGVTWTAADVRDTAALAPAVDGADAVLWCVGATKAVGDVGRTALPPLVAELEKRGVRRFVGVSGAGAALPGDRRGPGATVLSAVFHRLMREQVADKEGEYAALAASGLDWTQVRPSRMADRPGTGRYLLTDVAPGLSGAALAKADAALAMLDLAEGRDRLHAAPFLVPVR